MIACGDETVPGLGDVVYIVQRCRRRGLERWRLVDLLNCWSAAQRSIRRPPLELDTGRGISP